MDRDSPRGAIAPARTSVHISGTTTYLETGLIKATLGRSNIMGYQRKHYNEHYEKPVQCDRRKKTYSSVYAMTRHRRTNMHCRMSHMQTELEQSKPARS